jgi:hypothetical protein
MFDEFIGHGEILSAAELGESIDDAILTEISQTAWTSALKKALQAWLNKVGDEPRGSSKQECSA